MFIILQKVGNNNQPADVEKLSASFPFETLSEQTTP